MGLFLCVFIWLCPTSNAEEVSFIHTPSDALSLKHQIELVADFYGLRTNALAISTQEKNLQVIRALRRKDTLAAIITGGALSALDLRQVLEATDRKPGKPIPLLVLDLTEDVDPSLLQAWSAGTVVACRPLLTTPAQVFYSVVGPRSIVRQLSGQDFPFDAQQAWGFILEESRPFSVILGLKVGQTEQAVFLKTTVEAKEVFFLAYGEPAQDVDLSRSPDLIAVFSRVAPLLMFISYAAGERGWHTVGHFANLTIDDPWLTEPYGHLSFRGLLDEMERANFHTTIGFIPWNFDRSRPEVVSLIRKNPDRFSISLHGNNHDHEEFYADAPFGVHEANIHQAVARMEKFKDLTKLPYDRVMVFPHKIAPASVLGLLKTYNFEATVNASNFPSGTEIPVSPLFALHSFTLSFANLPSFKRYSIPVSRLVVAINSFLGNPILLYGHHDFFKESIRAFNPIAQLVNETEPRTAWHSLSHIVQHSYMVRLINAGEYEVKVLASSFCLDNWTGRPAAFVVRKEENNLPPIRALLVDGLPHSYEVQDGQLLLKMSVPSNASRRIWIDYENKLDLAAIDISKANARVNLLRRLSDFRDLTLSRSSAGRAFIRAYYGVSTRELVVFLFAVLMIAGFFLKRCMTRAASSGLSSRAAFKKDHRPETLR